MLYAIVNEGSDSPQLFIITSFIFLLSFSTPSFCINSFPIPLIAFVEAISHPLNALRMSLKHVFKRNITLSTWYINQPFSSLELIGSVQARKQCRVALEQLEEIKEIENPILIALARIEHRMNAIEACNEHFETRYDDLEVSQQDQLIQLTKFIDEIK